MAQVDNYSFFMEQAGYWETEAYAIQYPDIQFRDLVDVDTDAPDWTPTVYHYTTDKTGSARHRRQPGQQRPLRPDHV